MPTIFDYVNAQEIGSYIENQPNNEPPYLGATLFPARKQVGLDLSWIKGSGGAPVALMPSEFDTKATVRDRIGFTDVKTEMPFFRESMRIGERERQQLVTFLAANNSEAVKTTVRKIYDDATTLVKGANVQPERMIMQLLSEGKISISANRVDYEYDYGMKDDHKEDLLAGARWSEGSSTPIEDIQRWQEVVEDNTGTKPTRAITTRKAMQALIKHVKAGVDSRLGFITDAEVTRYIQQELGLSIAVYNKKYRDEKGVAKNFFAEGVFTLIPEGNLGQTVYGTTPEEIDLMDGNTEADVRIVNTGVAVTTYKEVHPVNAVTVVSEIVLPSFERIDEIFIAKVL
ncbi:major capsid protein [Sporosarcina contaminans]|uniref:Major capsid protein n=1 Tax=Sporosarcina contaminans TaxID=633403 RepID=A0ABW3U0L0_9BACL